MKKCFYILEYEYIDENNNSHFFNIGYFSSIKNVRFAIEEVKEKPGFKETNGVYKVNKFYVDFKSPIKEKSGLEMFLLFHEYMDSEGYDNSTEFGIYETYEEAENELFKKSIEHPYCDYSDGFDIAEIKVDLCGWSEGFKSWED